MVAVTVRSTVVVGRLQRGRLVLLLLRPSLRYQRCASTLLGSTGRGFRETVVALGRAARSRARRHGRPRRTRAGSASSVAADVRKRPSLLRSTVEAAALRWLVCS